MSSVGSLFTGASGLTASGKALSVAGDNIANANTVGFKRSRANFEDVLARSVGSSSGDVGMGSRVAQVQRLLTQGGLVGTGVSTDLAISGDGFFQVKGNAGGLDGEFYTRAGQFKIDNDGFIVTQNELNIQGYNADISTGVVTPTVTDLQVPTFELPPQPTENATIAGNIDVNELTPTLPWDVTDATNTSNFSTAITVFDSLGSAHNVTAYFRKEAGAGAWTWHGVVDGGEVTGGTAGTPTEIGSGSLTFDNEGRLSAGSPANIAVTFTGAAAQSIDVDFGDATGSGGSGLRGMTQYSAPSAISFLNQDGSSSGSLSGISIESDGNITGVFTNGKQRTVGKVLLAGFQDPQDLQAIGSSLFIETSKSGPPVVGEAATGGRGVIKAGTLEQSNVDLAEEFINLIAFQRGYQANARTVTTADQVLQETVGLKR